MLFCQGKPPHNHKRWFFGNLKNGGLSFSIKKVRGCQVSLQEIEIYRVRDAKISVSVFFACQINFYIYYGPFPSMLDPMCDWYWCIFEESTSRMKKDHLYQTWWLFTVGCLHLFAGDDGSMVGLTNGWRVIPDQIDEARKLESSDILIFRNSDQSSRRQKPYNDTFTI